MTDTAPTAEATQDTSGQDVTLTVDDVRYLLQALEAQHATIGRRFCDNQISHAEACTMDDRHHTVEEKVKAMNLGGTLAVIPF